MTPTLTIHGELRLPGALLAGHDMVTIEQQLSAAGLLPPQAQRRRWRMDHEQPGGYILAYTVVLPLHAEEMAP